MEITVVIVLIATISMLAMPRFRMLLDPEVDRDVQLQLENVLIAVRQNAILDRRTLVVLYDVEKGTYQTAVYSGDTVITEGGEQPESDSNLNNMTVLKRTLPEGLKFMDIMNPRDGKVTEGTCYTIVRPTGWIEPTTIHVKNEKDEAYTLTIEPLAGTVRLEEGYKEARSLSS